VLCCVANVYTTHIAMLAHRYALSYYMHLSVDLLLSFLIYSCQIL